jgi:hypothetical protein
MQYYGYGYHRLLDVLSRSLFANELHCDISQSNRVVWRGNSFSVCKLKMQIIIYYVRTHVFMY